MPSQRKAGKKLVGFFATEEESAALHAAAEMRGMTVADFLRSVISDPPKQTPTKPKRGAKRSREK